MISTIYGHLPLVVYPQQELPVTQGGRAQVCKVRGGALGHQVNVEVTLDVNTGELLLMSPDGFVGGFRLGDLVTAHLHHQMARAAAERTQQQEGTHAPTH